MTDTMEQVVEIEENSRGHRKADWMKTVAGLQGEIDNLRMELNVSRDAITGWCVTAAELRREKNALKVELMAMTAERDRWIREVKKYRIKLAEIEEAARALMDVTEYDSEVSESRNLRGFVWNDADNDAKIAAEGYQE